MKTYIKMIVFVLILGVVTSVLLSGMDMLTKERISANKEAELKSKILDAYNIDYSLGNVDTTFEASVTVTSYSGIVFYVNEQTGNISYVFEGSGVWGPIIGIITLESDFETIVGITILEQEETPGLGGVVAEEHYLANYVGKKMLPSIRIIKNATDSENEVIAISGATRTSTAFEKILNESFITAKTAWDSRKV